jgi:hypothetical protein
MNKALLISGSLIVMLIVFAAGVLSGLDDDRYSFSCPSPEKSFSPVLRPIDKLLRSHNNKFSNISGQTSTINGIPIKMWLGKSLESAKSIINSYYNRWGDNSLLVSETGTRDACFANGIDLKKKTFYGSMALKNNNGSTVIPFSIDMSKPKFKDSWDPDFPKELKNGKAIHFRTTDGPMNYESLFYIEKYPVGRTISRVDAAFYNAGWKYDKTLTKKSDMGIQNINIYVKNNKSCIVSVAPASGNSGGEAMVAIQMGNI